MQRGFVGRFMDEPVQHKQAKNRCIFRIDGPEVRNNDLVAGCQGSRKSCVVDIEADPSGGAIANVEYKGSSLRTFGSGDFEFIDGNFGRLGEMDPIRHPFPMIMLSMGGNINMRVLVVANFL
jgi:hypothetical protein